jgi:hypothetical protein
LNLGFRFIGNLYNKVSGRQTRVLEYLGPEIEERKRKVAELGSDYEGRPVQFILVHLPPLPADEQYHIFCTQDDLISWLMDSAPSALERETSSIALRVLIVNFMGHHSTFTVSSIILFLATCTTKEELILTGRRSRMQFIIWLLIHFTRTTYEKN